MFFEIEPEVSGEWGENTEADVSVHPPIVTKLHYKFSGWLGDCLVESFPCYIITDDVLRDLENSPLTGYEIEEIEVSLSEDYAELHPGLTLPAWHRLKPVGVPGSDDFAFSNDFTLVVSEQALELLNKHGIKQSEIKDFRG